MYKVFFSDSDPTKWHRCFIDLLKIPTRAGARAHALTRLLYFRPLLRTLNGKGIIQPTFPKHVLLDTGGMSPSAIELCRVGVLVQPVCSSRTLIAIYPSKYSSLIRRFIH